MLNLRKQEKNELVLDLTKKPSSGSNNNWLYRVIDEATFCLKKINLQVKEIENENLMINCNGDFKNLNSGTDFHNIIAFTGDRGTGKTTAMRIFLEKLICQNDNSNIYLNIPIIDPSKMTDGESLLAFVIASIYDSIRDIIYNNSIPLNTEQKEKYREVYLTCGM